MKKFMLTSGKRVSFVNDRLCEKAFVCDQCEF